MSRGERYAEVSFKILQEALFHDRPKMETSLPDDVEVERFWREGNGSRIAFVLSSEEWDEMDEGMTIPRVEVIVEEKR